MSISNFASSVIDATMVFVFQVSTFYLITAVPPNKKEQRISVTAFM